MAPFISRTNEQVRFDQLQNLPAGIKSGIALAKSYFDSVEPGEAVFCAMFDISMLYENCSGSVTRRLAVVVVWRSAKASRLPACGSRKSQTLYHRGTCEAGSALPVACLQSSVSVSLFFEAAHIFGRKCHVEQPVSLKVGTYSGTYRRSLKFILTLAFH